MMGTELWEGAITGKEWTSPMNVTWEKTKTLNLGLDFAFLNNKFSVSADYFIQKTEDMLLSMPQSLSFGLSGNPTVNAGTVENKGFEISLNHRNNVGDLYYHVGVNATFIKNELTEVNGSRDEWQGFNPHAKGTITYAKTGHSIGYFNLIKTMVYSKANKKLMRMWIRTVIRSSLMHNRVTCVSWIITEMVRLTIMTVRM